MKLHISNRDAAGGKLKRLYPADAVLPWRDMLHEGPVPARVGLKELDEVRAAYLAGAGYGALAEIRAQFQERESILARWKEFDEVVLWFEHDLYDQLQLLQVLDALHAGKTSLAQADTFLGPMLEDDLAALFARRKPVTDAQRQRASAAWAAFRAPDPNQMLPFCEDGKVLRYLAPAFRRFCEEYPGVADGLSRTERATLRVASRGVKGPGPLFRAFCGTEDPVFLGDAPFFRMLEALQEGRQPLLTDDGPLTAKGKAVLAGTDDRIRGNGVDRWLGGVHLVGEDSPWRYSSNGKSSGASFLPRKNEPKRA